MMKPVPPHEQFIDAVAVHDVTIDPTTGLAHLLPASFDDAYAIFLWLCALAGGESHESWLESYANFGRVFAIGDSIGGNLVHKVATQAGANDVEPLKLVAEPSKSFLELPENPLLTREMLKKFMLLALPFGSTMDHPIICPMGTQAPSLATLSQLPMLVVVAEMDLLINTELEYCEVMKEAEKEVEVLINERMSHNFYLNKAAIELDEVTATQAEKLILEITSFINKH
ncbi:hypothetical protein P3X46_009098 [Hevea brasiliensis]|uniref:Alpha/beta hydrolase fold-3 domain-containing protein n=1 Tax=Hevea brasiliensis TaxID=3981 RepID=A0ABQ9ML85_HEVBR|nr:hypothetical protein P3X46_009098 [Hevea brasiliensis]